MNNDPDTGDPNFFGGKARLYYGRWDYKYEQAARLGAIAAMVIHTDSSAGYPWQVVQTSWSGKQFELPVAAEQNQTTTAFLMKSWLTDEAAKQLVQLGGQGLDQLRACAERRSFKPVPLGVTLSTVIKTKYRKLKTANIIGRLPGSDPVLQKQAVVLTAHYDHLGIGTAVAGDSIYNGSLDNASGVASMLALAQAFVQLSPTEMRRSLVFAAVDGEEAGLLGSQYYAEHPTDSPNQIAAAINIDGINIWGKSRDITIVGFGKSTIDEVVKAVAQEVGRIVLPDQMPEQGSFYRSDQFNFAKIGVPVLYLDVGLDIIDRPPGWGKEQVEGWNKLYYHQPTDEYDPNWDLTGQVEDLKLTFRVALRLANDEQMPTWLPGDEFESVRLESLRKK